nr:hypothetical protein CFP56_55780 [Quercus suber]
MVAEIGELHCGQDWDEGRDRRAPLWPRRRPRPERRPRSRPGRRLEPRPGSRPRPSSRSAPNRRPLSSRFAPNRQPPSSDLLQTADHLPQICSKPPTPFL